MTDFCSFYSHCKCFIKNKVLLKYRSAISCFGAVLEEKKMFLVTFDFNAANDK